MLGFIHISFEAFVRARFGDPLWLQLVTEARCSAPVNSFFTFLDLQAHYKAAAVPHGWISTCPYADGDITALVDACAAVTEKTREEVLELYGAYFLEHALQSGYGQLLRALGDNMQTFCVNLNNLHLLLGYSFKAMRSHVTSSSLLLHYTTSRPGMGLHFLSKGILTAVGPTLFGHSTAVEIIDCSDGGEATLSVSFPRITEVAPKPLGLCLVGLNPIQFADLHPFHMLLDSRCRVLQVGAILTRLFATTLLPESHVMDTFRLAHPYLPEETLQSSAALHTHIASSFVFASIASGLRLKGQLLPVELEGGAPALLFLLTPMLHSLGDADRHGIFLSDIANHDASRDLLLLAEHTGAEASLKAELERTVIALEAASAEALTVATALAGEKLRYAALLDDVFPRHVAQRLLAQKSAADEGAPARVQSLPLARRASMILREEITASEEELQRRRHSVDDAALDSCSHGSGPRGDDLVDENHDCVTVVFIDIAGFTAMADAQPPLQTMRMLHQLFVRFDAICIDVGLYKVETIGDCHMSVSGINPHRSDHAAAAMLFALHCQHAAAACGLHVRVGLQSGPVTSGLIGRLRARWCLFGDTVNVASRLESTGSADCVHTSQATWALAGLPLGLGVQRSIEVKGKGAMSTVLLDAFSDNGHEAARLLGAALQPVARCSFVERVA